MGILVGKPEGKRPLGRPRSRWVDNIVMCYPGNVSSNLWILDFMLDLLVQQ
jgi:hypothetical protein